MVFLFDQKFAKMVERYSKMCVWMKILFMN